MGARKKLAKKPSAGTIQRVQAYCVVCTTETIGASSGKAIALPDPWVNLAGSKHGFLPACGAACARRYQTGPVAGACA